jgi:hypothetical protein
VDPAVVGEAPMWTLRWWRRSARHRRGPGGGWRGPDARGDGRGAGGRAGGSEMISTGSGFKGQLERRIVAICSIDYVGTPVATDD